MAKITFSIYNGKWFWDFVFMQNIAPACGWQASSICNI
jgi:hypothetical protein